VQVVYIDRNGEPVPRPSKEHELVSLLYAAVAKCSIGAKKLAVQLSGGLDSAVIQAIADCPNLYCCTWEDQDNLSIASLAAKGHEIKTVTFTRDDMLEVLPTIAKLTGGRGTWSQVCQYFLGKAMAADGVDVVLNGEGSDELFGGYSRYRILYWLDKMYRDPRLAAYDSIVNHVVGHAEEVLVRALDRVTSHDVAVEQAKGAKWERGLVGAMASVEETVGLAELIGFERDIAAHHGIEHRWPYMDRAVQDFAHALEPDEMVDDAFCKVMLRRAAHILGVDWSIINEKTKRGLFIPQSWRPEGEPMWSRGWFDRLMAEANGT